MSVYTTYQNNVKHTFMPVVGRGLRCCCRGGGCNCTASAIMPHRHKKVCTGSWLLLLLVFVLQPCGNDNRWWKQVSKDAEKHENVIGSAVVSLQCHSLKSCTETKESQKHWILYVNKQHCQGYTCKKWSYFAQIQANSLMPWTCWFVFCACFKIFQNFYLISDESFQESKV